MTSPKSLSKSRWEDGNGSEDQGTFIGWEAPNADGELSINITATMEALYDDNLRAIWCCFARLQIATVGT